ALVLSETVVVTLAGGLLGVGAALAVLWWAGIAVGTEGVTVALSPSPWLLAPGAAVAPAVGVLAGGAPARRGAPGAGGGGRGAGCLRGEGQSWRNSSRRWPSGCAAWTAPRRWRSSGARSARSSAARTGSPSTYSMARWSSRRPRPG